jgi:hypothetical protein
MEPENLCISKENTTRILNIEVFYILKLFNLKDPSCLLNRRLNPLNRF